MLKIRGGGINGAVKWTRDKKEFKIKKEDQNRKPVKGAVFTAYNTKADAENNKNPIGSAESDNLGHVDFSELPLYYEFYIKETSVPEGYAISKEIIPIYKDNGVRFLGEISPENIKIGQIEAGNGAGIPNPDGNINEKLQDLVIGGEKINRDTNWLVFNDNGIEKLVAKKPLKYAIPWNNLYKAGVVFGKKGIDDLINADFSNTRNYNSSQMGQDAGRGRGTPKTYEPTYVKINNKKYIIRLMRAYSDDTSINDRTNKFSQYARKKGSEWNRLILPLIDPTKGRYGLITKDFVESNMPTLANYSWWTDFGGNDKLRSRFSNIYYGITRWAQETGYNYHDSRALCGNSSYDDYAAYSDVSYPFENQSPYSKGNYYGWLPVLELVENN